MPIRVDISIAKHKLEEDPTGIGKHWGLCFKFDDNEVFYAEIEGASKGDGGSANVVNYHGDVTKYSEYEKKVKGKESSLTKEEFKNSVREWCDDWVSRHPYYQLHRDNCQRFVCDFFLEFDLCKDDPSLHTLTQHEECQQCSEKTIGERIAKAFMGYVVTNCQNDTSQICNVNSIEDGS